MAIITQLHTITYELSIDTETGEIVGTKIVSKKEENNTTPKKVNRKKTQEEDSEPKVYLEENKIKHLYIQQILFLQVTPTHL